MGVHPTVGSVGARSGDLMIEGAIGRRLEITVWRNGARLTSLYSHESLSDEH